MEEEEAAARPLEDDDDAQPALPPAAAATIAEDTETPSTSSSPPSPLPSRAPPGRGRELWASATATCIVAASATAAEAAAEVAAEAAARRFASAGARRAALRCVILAAEPATRGTHDLAIIDDLLQRCDTLAGLPRGARYELARAARLRRRAGGDVVCLAGAPVERVVVVLSGALREEQEERGDACSSINGGVGGTREDGATDGGLLLPGSCVGVAALVPVVVAAAAALTAAAPAATATDSGRRHGTHATAAAHTQQQQQACWQRTIVAAAAASECAEIELSPPLLARLAAELGAIGGTAATVAFLRDRAAHAFAGLPPAALAAVARIVAVEHHARGAVVSKAGGAADSAAQLLVVRSGFVLLLRAVELSAPLHAAARSLAERHSGRPAHDGSSSNAAVPSGGRTRAGAAAAASKTTPQPLLQRCWLRVGVLGPGATLGAQCQRLCCAVADSRVTLLRVARPELQRRLGAQHYARLADAVVASEAPAAVASDAWLVEQLRDGVRWARFKADACGDAHARLRHS